MCSAHVNKCCWIWDQVGTIYFRQDSRSIGFRPKNEYWKVSPPSHWGWRGEPINRRTEIHMFGRQLFTLQVFINESKSETLVLKRQFWHVDLWVVAASTLKTPFFLQFCIDWPKQAPVQLSNVVWSHSPGSEALHLPPRYLGCPASARGQAGHERIQSKASTPSEGGPGGAVLGREKWISAVISPTFPPREKSQQVHSGQSGFSGTLTRFSRRARCG